MAKNKKDYIIPVLVAVGILLLLWFNYHAKKAAQQAQGIAPGEPNNIPQIGDSPRPDETNNAQNPTGGSVAGTTGGTSATPVTGTTSGTTSSGTTSGTTGYTGGSTNVGALVTTVPDQDLIVTKFNGVSWDSYQRMPDGSLLLLTPGLMPDANNFLAVEGYMIKAKTP